MKSVEKRKQRIDSRSRNQGMCRDFDASEVDNSSDEMEVSGTVVVGETQVIKRT